MGKGDKTSGRAVLGGEGLKVEARDQSDTIRLWEGYRDQALLWRTLFLAQMPITGLAIVAAIILAQMQSPVIKVPSKPLPGTYVAEEIPQSDFIDVATSFVNLIASYQPVIAKRQFSEARRYLIEPLLSKFNVEMMGTELRAIESTNRTQVFFVDPTKTLVERIGRDVVVTFVGERLKIISGKEFPTIETIFRITLTTIPHNPLNTYGIVVKGAEILNSGT